MLQLTPVGESRAERFPESRGLVKIEARSMQDPPRPVKECANPLPTRERLRLLVTIRSGANGHPHRLRQLAASGLSSG